VTDRRLATLRAALGFLQLAPELRLLHRWLDTWQGIGLITVGVERHGYRLSLSHIAEDEWRAAWARIHDEDCGGCQETRPRLELVLIWGSRESHAAQCHRSIPLRSGRAG
jgi:hypothetical protein